MGNFFEKIGSSVIKTSQQIINVLALLVDTIYWIFVGPFRKKAAKRQSIFEQMVFVGVKSLLIVFFVALFTGVVIAMQTAPQLESLGAVIYVAGLVAVSITRELGPVLTGLVIAGRVGAAMSAELGTMKVTEQVEALECMALNPVRFLVVPRFLALIIMLPCLTVLADAVGIFGGYLIGVFNLNINPGLYIDTTFRFLTAKDIMTGVAKSFVFGGIIALIGCYYGLNTSGGAEGVGKSTTTSIVTSFILIIVADCILTAIFFFTNV
ncbi:MAG: ABC transporter permease [Candidatus Omnitrophica bacterium]|nr:ABC transporter permease [Candidatus Omnitrophota bacterium]MBU4488128.1 ABC transporter permease [Candidatus Omnitrophota bacterium]MCG2704962.1 ABC transporter permease [Candidatus Omnitrophota bacterium]